MGPFNTKRMPGYMRSTAASSGRQKKKSSAAASSESTPELDVEEEPLLPIVDQKTVMLREIIEKNESNTDNSGSYYKMAVSNFELKQLIKGF